MNNVDHSFVLITFSGSAATVYFFSDRKCSNLPGQTTISSNSCQRLDGIGNVNYFSQSGCSDAESQVRFYLYMVFLSSLLACLVIGIALYVMRRCHHRFVAARRDVNSSYVEAQVQFPYEASDKVVVLSDKDVQYDTRTDYGENDYELRATAYAPGSPRSYAPASPRDSYRYPVVTRM